MPDVHPLLDANTTPYDIGVMGQLDVRMLAELFGGQQTAAALTPAWAGGVYYAVQEEETLRRRTQLHRSPLLYLSQWKIAGGRGSLRENVCR